MELDFKQNEIAGLIVGLVPFVFSVGTKTTETVNGQVVNSSSLDLVAVICGVLAIVAAGAGASILLDKKAGNKNFHILMTVLMVALGGFQLARGFGLLG